MKTLSKILFVIFCIGFVPFLHAQTFDKQTVQAKIDAAVQPHVTGYMFTAVIISISRSNGSIAAVTIPNIPTAVNCDSIIKIANSRPLAYDAYCLPVVNTTR